MSKESELKNTFTVSVKDSNGKQLHTIIKKGSIEERKAIYLLLSDPNADYFEPAEKYIKNNYVSGDNLFADEEALFGATTKLTELILFDAAKQVETPAGVDAKFTIETRDGELYHFSKPSVAVKKTLFRLIIKGVSDPFTMGEIVLRECQSGGSELSEDPEVIASASLVAAAYIEYNEATVKKN